MVNPPPAYKGDEPYVFVSYSHEDETLVSAQIRWLQERGVNVYYDEGINPGSEWSDALAGAIKECTKFLYFITPRSVLSENCRRELNFAIAENRPVLAVHLENTDVPDGIRLNLDNRQAVLKPRLTDAAYERSLLEALAAPGPDVETLSNLETPTKLAAKSTRTYLWLAAVVAFCVLVGSLVFAFRDLDVPQGEPVAPTSQTFAVLPLRNLSPDRDLDWLAEGLTEELRRQISVWGQFNVLPSAFVRNSSIEDLPADVDLVFDGYIQGTDVDTSVSMNLIDLTGKTSLWSQTFSVQNEEPFELQRQIATSISRFFGQSIGGDPPRPRPEAYEAFLRLLPHLTVGDADEHAHWLQRTLELDPEWSYGWADLVYLTYRSATLERNAADLEKANVLLKKHWDDTEPYFHSNQAMRVALFSDDAPSDGEEAMRVLAEFGAPQLYGWLLLTAGLYPEAEAFAERFVEDNPFDHLSWQILALARGNLGDVPGTLAAARGLMRLYPDLSGNAPAFLAWVLPNAGRIEEAQKMIIDLEHTLQQKKPGSMQSRMLEQLAYYPLVFELSVAEGNLGRAIEVADWFVNEGMDARAGILYLRLDDPRAEEYLARDPEPGFDRLFWSFATLHLTPELRKHPRIIDLEAKLGYTKEWRLEFCKRVSALRPESYLSCDPARYSRNI